MERAFETIRYEVRDRVAWITLNRPKSRNALNRRMRFELRDAFGDVKANDEVWLAVLAGEGPVFCAGADPFENLQRHEGPDFTGDDLYRLLRSVFKPIICAINGLCLAQGAGLALLSDIRIMSETGRIGWPQVRRGIASISGPVLLVDHVPAGVALRYLLTGDFIEPHTALRLHLVHEVVAVDQVLPAAERWAARILDNAPLAVRAIKETLIRGFGLTIEERLPIARAMLDRLYKTEDAREGIEAFGEQRKPVWKGR